MRAWMIARGADHKIISRVLNEEMAFTGLAIVDALGMKMGLNLFPMLTIVPSRQKGAPRRMAIDFLWNEIMNDLDLTLSEEDLAEANKKLRYVLRTKKGQKRLAKMVKTLEAMREEKLGPPTERDKTAAKNTRKNAKKQGTKARKTANAKSPKRGTVKG